MMIQNKFIFQYVIILFFVCLISACGGRKSMPQQSVQTMAKIDSNDYKIVIPKLLDNYFKAINEQKWDVMMDMIYPKLFDIVPKELMMQTFTGIANTGMKMETGKPTINRLAEVVVHEGEQFVGINYSGTLKLSVLEGSEIDDTAILGVVTEMYEASYGKENVAYAEEQKTFTIHSVKSMFAIAPIASNDWKFIENSTEQPTLLEQLIPEVARKAISE